MTDEVAELVLDNNQAQTLALVIARRQALPMVNVHARYIDVLETEGWLDRGLEFLPTDKQIAERQAAGNGLQAPELAVLIAYTKNANVAEMERTDLPDVDAAGGRPRRLLPVAAARAATPTPSASTRCAGRSSPRGVVNQMVNLSGISFDHRMTEDTGASVVDVTRAWIVAREVLGFPALWAEIDALGGVVPLDVQLDLFLDCRRMAERGALWLLRHRRPPIDIAGRGGPVPARHRRAGPPAGAGARRADGRRRALRRGVAADGRGPRGPRRAGRRVAAAAHRVRPRRGRPGPRPRRRRRRPGRVGDVRPPRPDVAVGRHRRPAALGPLADAGPLGGA